MPYEMVRLLNSDHPYRYDGTIFGGTKLWTPAQITTALWLDADSPSSITLNGSTVSQWNDKSGNERHATQATGANQPTYGATLINGKAALSFDGINDSLSSAATSISFSTSASIFMVATNTGTASEFGGSFDFIGNSNFIDVFSGAPSQIRWEIGDPATGSLGSNTHTVTANTPYILSSARNTSLINGGDQKTFAQTGVLTAPITSNARVGSYFSAYKGNVGEIVLLAAEASVDLRQRVEGYLAWKWGTQADLPVDHPYKNTPPTV